MDTKDNIYNNDNNHSHSSADSSEKKTILYIEDNAVNRELVHCIIDLRSNLICIEAEDGKQGVELARRHLPHVILLDLKLPDMDGFTVLQHLKGNPETATIPVIALTGGAPLQDEKSTGFKGFLSKPLDINKFYDTLDSILQS